MVTASAPFHILLVEDNPADVRLTIEALKDEAEPSVLTVAKDGAEAMSMLLGEKARTTVQPDLVLLDLNLPKRDGREVLSAIRKDSRLRHIPVVILSTSQAEQDVLQAYQLGANAFITKPVDMDRFFTVIRSIHAFWFSVASLLRA